MLRWRFNSYSVSSGILLASSVARFLFSRSLEVMMSVTGSCMASCSLWRTATASLGQRAFLVTGRRPEPGDSLLADLRAAGLAGGAVEHDPAAGIPVADVEHVARHRAVGRRHALGEIAADGADAVAIPADPVRRRVEQRGRLREQRGERVDDPRTMRLAPRLRRARADITMM